MHLFSHQTIFPRFISVFHDTMYSYRISLTPPHTHNIMTQCKKCIGLGKLLTPAGYSLCDACGGQIQSVVVIEEKDSVSFLQTSPIEQLFGIEKDKGLKENYDIKSPSERMFEPVVVETVKRWRKGKLVKKD